MLSQLTNFDACTKMLRKFLLKHNPCKSQEINLTFYITCVSLTWVIGFPVSPLLHVLSFETKKSMIALAVSWSVCESEFVIDAKYSYKKTS